MCQRDPIIVEESESVTAAARLMREQHVGYLIVTQPPNAQGARNVTGVLTDRDIVVAVVAREVDPGSVKVGDVMTRSPLLIGEDHSLDAVLCFMRDAGVRRVPVVGKHSELLGVLSLDDVLKRMADQLMNVAGSIRSELRTERLVRP